MQIKLFCIPIVSNESLLEEMNHFLRANKIIDIKRELATIGDNSCWSFCVTYIQSNRNVEQHEGRQSNGKIDYKEILAPEEFERFSQLRKCRKEIAESEAIPAYAIFTDAELSELAKLSELTITSMQKIPGIGKKKVEKYGNIFIMNITSQNNETSRVLDGADSES